MFFQLFATCKVRSLRACAETVESLFKTCSQLVDNSPAGVEGLSKAEQDL